MIAMLKTDNAIYGKITERKVLNAGTVHEVVMYTFRDLEGHGWVTVSLDEIEILTAPGVTDTIKV